MNQNPPLKTKLLAVGINTASNLGTLHKHPRFDWRTFRLEFLLWSLMLVSIPSFGYLLLRFVSRINLP